MTLSLPLSTIIAELRYKLQSYPTSSLLICSCNISSKQLLPDQSGKLLLVCRPRTKPNRQHALRRPRVWSLWLVTTAIRQWRGKSEKIMTPRKLCLMHAARVLMVDIHTPFYLLYNENASPSLLSQCLNTNHLHPG